MTLSVANPTQLHPSSLIGGLVLQFFSKARRNKSRTRGAFPFALCLMADARITESLVVDIAGGRFDAFLGVSEGTEDDLYRCISSFLVHIGFGAKGTTIKEAVMVSIRSFQY